MQRLTFWAISNLAQEANIWHLICFCNTRHVLDHFYKVLACTDFTNSRKVRDLNQEKFFINMYFLRILYGNSVI